MGKSRDNVFIGVIRNILHDSGLLYLLCESETEFTSFSHASP
jgi:hypothetical protein